MASVNKKISGPRPKTAGGAAAAHINPEKQLRRLVMSCMLWEDNFYIDGESHAQLISDTIELVKPAVVADIVLEAKFRSKLRHVPLFMVREMARLPDYQGLVAGLLEKICTRPDDMTEYLALYYKDGANQPLSAQSKRGLARAFLKFSEYQLAKTPDTKQFKLRDVLRLVHPKPKSKEQADMLKRTLNQELKTPDTWETRLSAGADKKKAFTDLMGDKALGALAFIRNFRNMQAANVSKSFVMDYAGKVDLKWIIPFQFIAAARHAPAWEDVLESMLLRYAQGVDKLHGKTVILVDVSGSMYHAKISGRSEMSRAEVACSMAMLLREICTDVVIYATAGSDSRRIHQTEIVAPRHGFALRDAIYNQCRSLGGGGIFLKQSIDYVKSKETTADRIIVITDEQDCSEKSSEHPVEVVPFGTRNYMLNIANERNGIGYGKHWTRLEGWSDNVIAFITNIERADNAETLDESIEHLAAQHVNVEQEQPQQ